MWFRTKEGYILQNPCVVRKLRETVKTLQLLEGASKDIHENIREHWFLQA